MQGELERTGAVVRQRHVEHETVTIAVGAVVVVVDEADQLGVVVDQREADYSAVGGQRVNAEHCDICVGEGQAAAGQRAVGAVLNAVDVS